MPASVGVQRVFVALWLLPLWDENQGVRGFNRVGAGAPAADIPCRRVLIAENSPCFLFQESCPISQPASASAVSTHSAQVRVRSSTPQSHPNHLSCLTVNFPHLCMLNSPNQQYTVRCVNV